MPGTDRYPERTATPSATVSNHCPSWCACDHSADSSETVFYHASETASVTVSGSGGPAVPDRLDVQIAQHVPDDPSASPWSPAVEIAVHASGRYRLIELTPEEACELAFLLTRATVMLSGDEKRAIA